MAKTPIYGLPFQALNDPPNGATLGADLAGAVETELERIDGSLQSALDRVTTLEGNQWQLVQLTADQSVASSTTPVNTALVIPVLAGVKYECRARVGYSAGGFTGSPTGGRFRWTWSVPAGLTLSRYTIGYGKTTADVVDIDDGGNVSMRRPGTTTQVLAGAVNTASTNSNFYSVWEDWYVDTPATANGNITFQFAQVVSHATATILRNNSALFYRRM